MQVERRRQTRKTSNTTRTQTQQKTVEFVELYADVLALISLLRPNRTTSMTLVKLEAY